MKFEISYIGRYGSGPGCKNMKIYGLSHSYPLIMCHNYCWENFKIFLYNNSSASFYKYHTYTIGLSLYNNFQGYAAYLDATSNIQYFHGNGNGVFYLGSLDTHHQTNYPTISPTIHTVSPTEIPSELPTYNPSIMPTYVPTMEPTLLPAQIPSKQPSKTPTIAPFKYSSTKHMFFICT